ncbi:glycosyltransferase [Paenibacillus sp. PR3]|uniref:Glycosyltransferase n=1 Tax=Paenibacillus terricola TaxID=2763503 RepID=A0ABR8N2I3_9BACL|nr:glycosyltransferase family 2 protein [Paenibacillus terricola]MBD3920674.1 glycosyltransferase [Paenibacillus terricola]
MERENLPGVSLCMIVRNEEAFIEACLRSSQPYVTEMIVCDTGSTDRTVTIAQSLGARVVYWEWTDDFAAARNYSISLASQPWILVLDADERLEPMAVEEWRTLLGAEGHWGYYVRLISRLGPTDAEQEGAAVTDAVCRLFRNDARIRFAGIIHEECATAVAALHGQPIAISSLVIRHEGYRSDVVAMRRKGERNASLLTRALAASPDDPLLRYAAGTELLGAGRWLEAAAWLQPLTGQLDESCGFASDVYLKLSHAYRMAGCPDEAVAAAGEGLRVYGDFPDLYEALAAVYMDRDDARAALQVLQQAIAIGKAAPYYSSVEGAGGYRTMYEAGVACERLYDWRGAATFYSAALKERPGLERAWVRLLLLAQGAEGELVQAGMQLWQDAVEQLLMLRGKAEDGESARTLERKRLSVAQLLLQLHEADIVAPYVERLIEGTGERGGWLLGWLRLQQGDLADTERLWAEALPYLQDGEAAMLQVVLDCIGHGRREGLDAVFDEALLLAGDWRSWLQRTMDSGGAGRPLPPVLQLDALLRRLEREHKAGIGSESSYAADGIVGGGTETDRCMKQKAGEGNRAGYGGERTGDEGDDAGCGIERTGEGGNEVGCGVERTGGRGTEAGRGIEQNPREAAEARRGRDNGLAKYACQPAQLRFAGSPFAEELAAGLLAAAAGRWREACDCFAAARSAAAHPLQGRAAASALAAAFAARASETLASGDYASACGAGAADMLPQPLRCCSELRLIALTALYPP